MDPRPARSSLGGLRELAMGRAILAAVIRRTAAIALGLVLAAGAAAEDAAIAPAEAAASATAAPAAGHPFPHEGSALPVDPAVTWGRLANGLRYAVMRNQQPRGKISLRLQVQNGSLQESDAQRGLAHFLEHMAFNGTTRYPAGKLIEVLQAMGIAFGAHSNAHTSFDETVYKLDLPDTKPETLATGLEVLADWGGGMLLEPEQVEKERGIILAEMRDRNTPGFREFLALARTRYPGLLIGVRAPIGIADTVAAASPELLRAYYDDWYRPDMMVLTVVGDVEPQAAEQALRAAFAPMVSRSQRKRPAIGSLTPGFDILCHHESEDDGTRASVELARPRPLPRDTPDERRWRLQVELAVAVFNRRISDLVEREPQGPVLGGGMGTGQWLDLWIAQAQAQARPGQALAALERIEIERRRLLEHGVTAAELAVAIKAMRSGLEQAVAQQGTRTNPSLANALYASVWDEEVFLSPEQTLALYAPMLDAATPATTLAAVRTAWEGAASHTMAAIVGREDLGPGGLDQTRAAWERARAAKVDPPAVTAAAAWAYGAVADGGTVTRTVEAAHGIRQLRLANRVAVNLKRTDFQPGQVLIALRLAVPPVERQPGLSELLSMAFMGGGLGKHPASELRELLAGTTARVDGPRFDDDGALFSGTCVPKDLESCLQQLRAWLVDPGWRSEGEARAKPAWIEALAAVETDLDESVTRAFRFAVTGNAPQRRPVAIDEARAATLADARRWFEPILQHAAIEASIVGDIDIDAAAALAKRYLGTLGERRELRVVDEPHAPNVLAAAAPIAAGEKRLTVKGANPRAVVLVAWPTDDFYDVRRTRRLGLLAEALNERLRIKVREELGQAYSPQAWREASEAYRGWGLIGALVGVAPERVADAHAAVLAIAAELAATGVDDALLAQVKEPMVRNLVALRQRNQYWLNSVMQRCQEQPFRLQWSSEMEADYAAITPAEISALAKQYLLNAKAFQVIGVCPGAEK